LLSCFLAFFPPQTHHLQQLKHHIVRREAEKEQRNRRKNLTKYVPDVSDALFKVLQKVYERDGEPPSLLPSSVNTSSSFSLSSSSSSSPHKSADGGSHGADDFGGRWFGTKRKIMARVHAGALTKSSLATALTAHAEASDLSAADLDGGGGGGGECEGDDGGGVGGSGGGGAGQEGKSKKGSKSGSSKGAAVKKSEPRDAFFVVLPDEDDEDDEGSLKTGGGGGDGGSAKRRRSSSATWDTHKSDGHPVSELLLPEIHHPAFSFRLLRSCLFIPPAPLP
jgi:hypothetical protein